MRKALIICGKLFIGGAEKVAYLIGDHAEKYQYECDYVVFEDFVGEYEEALLQKGCKIFHIPVPAQNYYAYWKQINKLIKEYQYDVVHCHTMFNSGIVLLAAKMQKVPCRIAHSHSICSSPKRKLSKKIYESMMRFLIKKTATDYVGCGQKAGEWLFGENFYKKHGVSILNGVNTELFKYNENSRQHIRNKHGIEGKFVIGHVGHLLTVKNQVFLLKLLPEIIKKNPNTVLMLVGEGQDRPMLEKKIKDLRLTDYVIMTGNVMNVQEYLCAMDVFVFPSLYEGMPLSILEVQSNGLPCVISDAVPKDVFLTDLLTVLSLDDSEKKWIDAVLTASRMEPEKYSQQMYDTGYDTEMMIQKIYDIYSKY